jgi:hypothetical protein
MTMVFVCRTSRPRGLPKDFPSEAREVGPQKIALNYRRSVWTFDR